MSTENEVVEDVDMSDTILATLRDINSREETDTETPEEPKTEAPRDDKGKFAKKESAPEQTKPAEDAPTPDKQVTPDAPAAEAVEVPIRADGKPMDLNRPPSEWKPAAKAEWANIPATIRSEILRRETDAFKMTQEVFPEAELGRSMRQALEPYRQAIEMDGGGNMVAGVQALARAAQILRFGTPQEKQAAFQHIGRSYGIQLGAIGQQPQEQQPQQPVFDSRVDGLIQRIEQQDRERQAQINAQTSGATQDFLSATDDKGQPLYPFVDNVLDDMVTRAQVLRQQNPAISHGEILKKAYEAAAWANPETRAQMMQQEQQAQLARTQQANLEKVAAAKRASAGNLPKRGTVPGAEPVGKMEDTILETYRRLTSG